MASAESTSFEQLFNELKIGIEGKSDVSPLLSKLVQRADSESDIDVSEDVLAQLNLLLQNEKQSNVRSRAAEIVANLAKKETHREIFSDKKLISTLCDILRQFLASSSSVEYAIEKQACRALGNLCYENDKCRKLVLQNDGLNLLSDVIKKTCLIGDGPQATDLRSCAVGLMLNFVVGFDDLDSKSLKGHLLKPLCDILVSGVESKNDETAVIHCLIILGVLAEADREPILNDDLCQVLVKTLRESKSGELAELCLELIHSQSEDASVSLSLAKAGLCELLIDLLEKHKSLVDDADTRTLFKMACDLIIITLNNDESMKLLFEHGHGQVYERVVNWLSSPIEDLLVSGVLAIVNFARADSHCIEMVKQGIGKKLLDILSKNNTDGGNVKLQHALLSALRNLIIPDENKSIVINDGLLETLYPMVSTSAYPVVFKLLGTLRIVCDKQEKVAYELGCKKDLIIRVVEWSTADHVGVCGEATRFLAWLIKNSKSPDVVDVFIECEAVPKLVEMILSDHEVMQNEAIFALTILSTVRLSRAEIVLKESKIGEKIERLINERTPKLEIFSNVLTFIRQLCISEALLEHLKQSKVGASLDMFLKNNGDAAQYKDEIHQLTNILKRG